MPIIYGIAALAVLSKDFDQTGIDPLVDRQYAVVKQNETPVVQATGSQTSTAPQITADSQVPGWSTSFIPEKRCGQAMTLGLNIDMQGTAVTGQSGAPATAAGQGTTVIVSGGTATATAVPGQVTVRSGQAVPGGAYTISSQGAPVMARTLSMSDSLRSLKGMDRKVSVKFNNATATDVLKWLSKQNINFVANTDNLPKSKVTMNVTNVPLHEALEAVAESLGGSWQVKGSTLIFRNGFFGSYAVPGGTSLFTPAQRFGTVKGFNIDPKQFKDLYNFKFDDSQMKALKGLDGKMFKWDDKAFKDMKTLDGKLFKFDESQLKALKDMKTLDGKMFKWDDKAFKDMKTLDGKLFKFDESQLKALKDMKTLDGKMFKFDESQLKALKDMKTLDGKAFKFDDKFMKDMKGWQDKAFTFKKIDVKKFLNSLTKEQKELQKKQGFLKASDLTEEQRKMLFDGPKGEMPKEMTLMLNQDGDKVVIKN